jgi:hypothetical protein
VTLVLRYADFHTFSRQRRLRHAVNHGLDIHAAVVGLLHEVRLRQAVRLVGVSVSGLERNAAQMPLFTEERNEFIADAWMRSMTGTLLLLPARFAERHHTNKDSRHGADGTGTEMRTVM